MRVSPSVLLRGWRVAALILLGLTGAIAARGAWQAIAAQAPPAASPASRTGYEVQDHFPGAAALYVADAPPLALPSGATGTIALPPVPISAARAQAMVAAETGIVSARPFALGAATGLDRARALQCLADAIYYEAASEPDAGQRAVAQVVLNRARHPAFPATVCGVVYQGSERGGCQFSFACDGAMARAPSRAGWARAARAAAAALAGYVYAPVGLATHYHTYAVTPSWNRTLVMTDVVGAHFFHRWKGYWGTAAAFAQAYRGGEPVPGPHVRVATPLIAAAPIAPTALPTTAPAAIQPAYRASSTATATSRPDDRLPPASPILDRWRDSGRPL